MNKTQKNGFSFLRLICAFQVFYGHVVTHLELSRPRIGSIAIIDKLLLPFQGVPVFFALSGYFIWKSLTDHTLTPIEYAKRRFNRIYPELWIVTGFSVILILIFEFRNISFIPFIAWIITQSTVFQFWTPDCLRSFGVGCPNGSLWTITIFIQFYFVIYFLHRFLKGKSCQVWGAVMFLCAMANVLPGVLHDRVPVLLYKLYQQTLFPHLLIFLYGAFIAEHQNSFEKILNSKAFVAALYAILATGIPYDLSGSGYQIVQSALVALFAISFGNTFHYMILKKDISYEIYLLHMPIVNIFLELGLKNWSTFFIILIITVVLATTLHGINSRIVKTLDQKWGKMHSLAK